MSGYLVCLFFLGLWLPTYIICFIALHAYFNFLNMAAFSFWFSWGCGSLIYALKNVQLVQIHYGLSRCVIKFRHYLVITFSYFR